MFVRGFRFIQIYFIRSQIKHYFHYIVSVTINSFRVIDPHIDYIHLSKEAMAIFHCLYSDYHLTHKL